MARKIGVIATPYEFCMQILERNKRMYLENIKVEKPGVVSGFIISDLKPCISADVDVDGHTVHIDRAVFDTGSNCTVIAPSELPSPLAGEDIEMHGVSVSGESHIARCRLSLDNGEIVLGNVPLSDFDLSFFDESDIKLIIGMDVITAGRLIVDARNNIPHFSFEVAKY